MEYLDFIADNYVWFIAGGVILLMTIIGYIAEKTDFGKKKNGKTDADKPKKEKKKKNKKKDVVDEVISDVPGEEKLLEMAEKIPQEVIEEPINEEPIIGASNEEEPMADLDEVEIQEPVVREDEPETIEFEMPQEETKVEEIPEDLYAGLDGTPNTYKAVEDDIDMDLPNIDALKDDVEEVPSDDDIWRF